MKSLRPSRGFTLVELMFVIAILAIVTAIGVPSFNTMIKNNRLTAATNDVVGALQYARGEAVRRGRTVSVTALNNDIGNGLRVWFDADSDGFQNKDELRQVRFSAPLLELSATPSDDMNISFDARGSASGSVEVTLCDDRAGNHGKKLELLGSGILRSSSGEACS